MGSCGVRGVKPRRCRTGPVLMLLICSVFTGVLAEFTELFDYIQNHGLPSHDDDLISGITPEECARKCLEGTTAVPEGGCLSFDYWKSRSRCQLSRDNKNTAGQPLLSHNDYDHYEMNDILSFFTAYPDQALPGHDDVIVRPATVSPRTCALRCLLGEGSLSVGSCLSFDLDSNPERCLLSRDNQDTAGQALGSSTRFNHYERNEFCVPNPCVRGSCTNETNGYTCTCDAGWEGDTCNTFTGTIYPQDCADLSAIGIQISGTYHVGHPQPFQVSCDMDTDDGGWTVIQRRQDGSVAFNNDWDVYVQGFGDISGEFWSGLDNIHRLTTQTQNELYVYLEDWDGESRYARYSTFSVGDSGSNYRATLSGYSGDATDSLTPQTVRHSINGREFTTQDRDNDDSSGNCATTYGQGGWWYPQSCGWAMLNNQYLTGCSTTNPPSCPTGVGMGIVWHSWKSTYAYSLKKTTMMIRPNRFPSSSLDTCQNGGTLTPGTPGSGVYTCVCPAGYGGTYCEQVLHPTPDCTEGTFGPDCNGTCHCESGGSVCDVMTGICSSGGCAAGWEGSDCQTACSPGEFGPGCNSTCHCLTGDSACNIQTGACTGGCAAGWKGDDCQTVCSPGEFGPNCAHTCHCADGDSVCPADTGVCTTGGCADGWVGGSCQIDVDECDTDVDNCHIYATCFNSAGSFNCSCNLGYQGNGTSCTEEKATATGLPIVGIIVGVITGVIGIGAVGAVVFYCRRKNKDAPKQRNVPLKNIGNQPKRGGARNEAFDSENGRDTSVSMSFSKTSERLSDLTTVADVQRFLIANGLQECARAFRENDVDGTALRHLDDAMMKDLVPMVGPRARLKAVLQGLSGSGTLVSSPTSSLNFWEIPRSSLKLGRRLGRGQFGEVRLGEVRNHGVATTVAVKTLRDSASDSDKKDLLGELEILVTVGRHDNIVSLVGACTKDDPLTIVVEYAPNGCLKDWLKNNSAQAMSGHSEYQNRPVHVSELPMEQLIQFGIDVAAGMSHLAAMQCVHRDLAARNILLGERLVAKVSDFGLSRDIFESEEYVKSTMSKLPLRWMAYESLFYSVYTTQSDIWSFGVLLWEIMTMGYLPYEGMTGKQMMDMIKNGGRLEQPLHCPDELFAVMQDCWKTLPEDRPTFPQLKTNLDRIIQAHKTYASLLHG